MHWSHKLNYMSVTCEIHYLVHLKSTSTIWRPLDFSQTCQKHGRLELLIKYQMIQHFCSGRNSGEQKIAGLCLYGQCQHIHDRYWSTHIVAVVSYPTSSDATGADPVLLHGPDFPDYRLIMILVVVIRTNGSHDEFGHVSNGSDEMGPMVKWVQWWIGPYGETDSIMLWVQWCLRIQL